MATLRSYFLSFLPIAATLLARMAVSKAQVMESSMYNEKMPFQCSKVSFCRKTANETYIDLSGILATFSSTTCQLSLDKGTLTSDLGNYFNKECVLKPNTADAYVVRSQTVIDLARESNCSVGGKLPTKLTVTYRCVIPGSVTTTMKPFLSSTERQSTTQVGLAVSVTPAVLLVTTTDHLMTAGASTSAVVTSASTAFRGFESTAAAALSTATSLTSNQSAPVATGRQVTSAGVTAAGGVPSAPTAVGGAGSTAAAATISMTLSTAAGLTFNRSTQATTRKQPVTTGVTAPPVNPSAFSAVGTTTTSRASNLPALVTTRETLATNASGVLPSVPIGDGGVSSAAAATTAAASSLTSNLSGTTNKIPLHLSEQTATWSFRTEAGPLANQTANVSMVNAKPEEWWSFFKTEPGVAVIASTAFLLCIAIAGIALLCSRRSMPKSSESLAADDRLANGSAVKLANLTSKSDKTTGRPSMQAERAMSSNQYEDISAMRRQSATPNQVAATNGIPLSWSQPRGPLPLPPQQNGNKSVEGWRRPSYLDGGSAAAWPAPSTSQDDTSSHYAPLVDASDMLRPLSERPGGEHRLSLGGVRRLSATFPSQAVHYGYAAMASIHEEDGGTAMRPLAVGAMPSPMPTQYGGVGADPARRPSQFLPRMSRSGMSGPPEGSAAAGGGATFPVVLNRRFSEMSINTPM